MSCCSGNEVILDASKRLDKAEMPAEQQILILDGTVCIERRPVTQPCNDPRSNDSHAIVLIAKDAQLHEVFRDQRGCRTESGRCPRLA